MKRLWIILALAAPALVAQTKVDLQAQGRTIDFSGAPTTRPVKTGSALPPTCQTGELFFGTNEPAGQNLFGCVAINTWARISAGATLQSGTGALITTAGSLTTIAVDTAVVPTFLVAIPIIDFPSIAAQSCAEQTVTFTGLTVGDSVTVGWPDALETGLTGLARVTAANSVAVRLCNVTAAAVNPASQTFRLVSVRNF